MSDHPSKRRKTQEPSNDDDESTASEAETPPPVSEQVDLMSRDSSKGAAAAAAPKKNAFSELMAPKPKPTTTSKTSSSKQSDSTTTSNTSTLRYNPRDPKDGLAVYILHPENHPTRHDPTLNRRTGVIRYDEDFVIIWDAYPKATVHVLLLSRNPTIADSHPTTVFDDPVFLEKVTKITEEIKKDVACELRNIFVKESKTEIKRRKALEQLEKRAAEDASIDFDKEEKNLPRGRDWMKSIRVGVHSRPSMNHFHVHIISEDMRSPCVKKKIHYNSFNTGFFVNLDEFPLAEDDERRIGVGSCKKFHEQDCICWRCKKVIFRADRKKGGWQALKDHLEEEFNEWKKI